MGHVSQVAEQNCQPGEDAAHDIQENSSGIQTLQIALPG
jgi:hypothetical protein